MQRQVVRAVPIPSGRKSWRDHIGSTIVVADVPSRDAAVLSGLGILKSWFHEPAPIPHVDCLVFVAIGAPAEDLGQRALRWLQVLGPSLRASANSKIIAVIDRHQYQSSSLAGIVKTVRHEWPTVAVRVIEVDEQHQSVADWLDEVLLAEPAEVRFFDGRWHEVVLQDQPQVPGTRLELRPGSLVVVSGGARGVTAAAALALAREYAPALLLLGRTSVDDGEPDWLTPLTEEPAIKRAIANRAERRLTPRDLESEYRRIVAAREVRATLKSIEAAGATVVYRSVDVTHAPAVAAAVAEARNRFGPVRGLVHGAGVLADRRIEDLTPDQYDRVYRTKVDGWHALRGAALDDPLAFAVFFSSSTGRFGRAGQAAYAAANEVLNAEARRLIQELPNCRTVAINWGPWAGGMVTPALEQLFAAEGVGLIPLEDGANFLLAELSTADRPAEVVVLGPAPLRPVEVTSESHPWLIDHRLNGEPVLPLTVAIEAFGSRSLADIRVLRPLQLPAVVNRVDLGDELQLTTDPRRPPNIRARRCTSASLAPCQPGHLRRFPLSAADAYERVLFHGPVFRAITSIEGWSAEGIRVVAKASAPGTRWWQDDRMTDPLIVDSALQAIILWTWVARNELSLPVAVGRFQQNTPAFPVESAVITVAISSGSGAVIRADADIADENGAIIAQLRDCEFVVQPGWEGVFGKRDAAEAVRT